MTNDGKENIRHVTCTNHTTRSDRDLFRVCPSKLSKRELEDLYFSLLENNKQLKKTVNGQRDQIKLLNTKVNRMTVQKNALGNLNKDCCSGVKAIINEQKESIADLKNANERLTDRIRLLNMRLCSAKQFLRRSPAQSATRCGKCCLTPNPSIKNSSMSALNAKRSDSNLRSQTEAGSCQFLNKENSTLKADENVEASLTEMKDEPCLQNKCRTVMDELKQKIENLEEELSKTHEQYSERMRKLEEQMRDLRVENTNVRAIQAESDHRLEAEEKRAGELLRKLRDAETQCDNLESELQIEKSKVCELETQVKAADLSSQLAAALERHLKNNITNRRASFVQSKTELRVPTLDLCASDWSYSPPMLVPNNSEISKCSGPENDNNVIKNSDDSGYAEKFDDKKSCPKSDQNIMDQIASLQAELNNLKLSMVSQNHNNLGDDTKSVTGDSLQKNESETNETYAVMGARSSLSEDIFRPSRLKNQFDQCPSTSRAPDFLISMEDINRSPPKGLVKTLNKFDSHSKFQIPLPVDAPRMPYFGETGNSHQSLNRLRQSGKKISSDSTFDTHFNESRDVIEDVEKQNDDLRINDENRNADHNAKEEILNGNAYDKKSRRSSLKFPHQDRSKDLSVSYDHNKTIVGSTIDIVDIDKDTQGDDNGKVIRAPCKYDSDPSVEFKVSERNLKKKIHYETQNSDTVPRNDSHFDARVSEKECGFNIDSNHKPEENFVTPNIKDKIDNINSGIQYSNDVGATKKVESPGTSSGKSTYTVEGKPSQGKMTKDATYQVDKEIKDATIQVENGDNHLDICQGHARICTCPHIPHRDVSVFRTCSGTLRFKTTPSTKNKFRQCHCTRDSMTDMHGNGCPQFVGVKASVNGQSAKRSRMLHPMNASTPNHQKTYKVEGTAEVTRSTSPDNTDHEISSLTDLPNEESRYNVVWRISRAASSRYALYHTDHNAKEEILNGNAYDKKSRRSSLKFPHQDRNKSPRDYISPGEEKATSTFSDSYAAATTTDYGSLSLGEIPISGAKKLSDTQTRDKQADTIPITTTSYKMEEALNAISEELTRCRELLQGQLPAQRTHVLIRDNSSMTEETPIELRRAEGKARIGGAATPKCIFTIHVGTVVLSDQAVMCSRGKSLALTWRFYNQTATMTRLLAGRVMPFDFSTEYDLKITDHFLNYLKLEEMPIVICEMEKQEEPFASCALPLRDALLHTNRRVDMSLALMAGPQMFLEQSMNNLETNEEVGVLDVWCLLRLEPSALAAINSSIINSQSPRATAYKSPRRSSLMEQMLDDDQSVEDRSSQELRMRTRARTKKSSDSTSIYDILKSKKWIRKRSSVSKDSRPEASRHKSVSYDPKLPLSQSSSILEHKDNNVHIIATDDTLQSIDITVLWLALNEDCKAMTDPAVKRLYIAYSFLGRSGAELETPTSLPKPKHYMHKLHFMFKKTFALNECDLPLLGHMARCRYPTAGSTVSASNSHDPKHCVVFTVVSEPPEDPLGLDSCEDVGFAYLYLGDVLAYSAGAEQYTAIVGVHTAGQEEAVCGAIAVKIDGLSLLRRCVALSYSDRSFEFCECN